MWLSNCGKNQFTQKLFGHIGQIKNEVEEGNYVPCAGKEILVPEREQIGGRIDGWWFDCTIIRELITSESPNTYLESTQVQLKALLTWYTIRTISLSLHCVRREFHLHQL